MNINVKFTPAMVGAETTLRNHTVVVIDTLRATSTIISALMAGAREVVPAATAEEAVKIAQALGTERTLLCGERKAVKIPGFHLGNSPLEYTPDVVGGKSLVLTTTNGTIALLKSRMADRVFCSALLNARAVAQRLHALDPLNVTILCAGTNENFSFEDALAAGAIVSQLQSFDFRSVALHDSARAASVLFESEQQDLYSAMASGDHGSLLLRLGMERDVRFCAQLDIPDAVVPELVGSTIRLQNGSAQRKTLEQYV
jgi:2-phosphosulfolactate phosphatase